MSWRSARRERDRLWANSLMRPHELPVWVRQLLVSLFIFSVLAGASYSDSSLASRIVSFAKKVTEEDMSYQEVFSWVKNLPEKVRALGSLDIRDFWSRAATGKRTELAWPAQGDVTTYFGWRPSPDSPGMSLHKGIDIEAPVGTRVLSTLDGVVSEVRSSPTMGVVVEIQHQGGLVSLYGHLANVTVAEGQNVRKSDVIGTVGHPGDAGPPRLHFEVHKDGVEVDPMTLLPPRVKGP